MKISRLSAEKLLKRRRKLAAPKELPIVVDFPAQTAFITSKAKFLVAQCGRRSGKTVALAYRFFKTLHKYPGAQCVYLALTRDSALSIMWPILQEINEKFNLGCRFLESKLTMYYPNGAKLRLLGADQKQFAKRLKGIKCPGIAIDESQDFGTHLQSLIDDVLTPTLIDYEDSWLALTGTPGPVPLGFFFEVTEHNKYGYEVHKWTSTDNPHLNDAASFIEDLKRKRGWTEQTPTLRREWRNQWVLDTEALWIRYKEDINHYAELPTGRYHYVLGIDIGYQDADALAVLAWSEDSPVTYLVEEVITKKQGVTELVEQIRDVCGRYDIEKMVIDEGGLGKKLAEEMRRRHGIPVQPADKMRKQEAVEFLNDSLATGNFKAKGASQFATDSYLIQIDWERSTADRIVIKKKPHSDIIDAVIYAYRESPAYTYQAAPKPPKYGTKEWADSQEDHMFEAEKEGLQREAEREKEASAWQDDWENF